MKKELSVNELKLQNEELAYRLEEAEQLIEAIKAGEVDAFALSKNNQKEIFTLQSGDYGYRMLVENITEGAVTLSEDGLIVYTNSYFHELLGISYDQVIGKPVLNFIHPDSKLTFTNFFTKGLAGQSKGEINLTAAGKIISVYVSLTSLQPTLQTVGMIVSDLTEKKKAEEEIKAKATELESKNIKLETLNKELQSFAYISSHDLQEPLRKIQIFVSRIIEKENQSLSPNGKDTLIRIQLASKRMQTLIEDLLSYSRTNAAERKIEETDLNKLIEEVTEDLQEEIREKQATIKATELCIAHVIPFQFRQLLHNLIGNSLKFCIPEQPPLIEIKSKMVNAATLNNEKLFHKQEYCHISISDNGIGFEQQYCDKIFEVFQRLHTKSEYNGTGIGLAIVKKIVDNHEGIITAHSEPGKGARFDIFIPVI